jgi:ribosomal protein L7/L12
MSFISQLIKGELDGTLPTNSSTEALTVYKEALNLGFTIQVANAFAEAVYKKKEGVQLKEQAALEFSKTINRGKLVYTVIVDGVETSSPNLISLFRQIEGLTVPQAKRLIDNISSENTYSKGGLTLEQAQELERRIVEAGGRTYIQNGIDRK